MKKVFFTLSFLVAYISANAQLSTNEQPVSFQTSMKLADGTIRTTATVTMPALDMEKIEAEDKEDEEYDMPPRFGYSHKVNYDLTNSGTWYDLPNGDKLWQLNVVCPGALSVNFSYNKFWIPEGGKFFVFSIDRKYSIGAFTSRNNKGDKENVKGFATGLVYGNDVVLEYYQPKDVISDAIISIEYVVHGYRYVNWREDGFGSSGSCQVNVNCLEGRDWQNEKNAVAMIVVNNNRICTGALINATDLSQKPYLLTANHCLKVWDNNSLSYIKFDADTLPNLDNFTFYWNYETPGCDDINIEPTFYSTSGAIVVANNSYSDFALLRLTEDPSELIGYTPYYLGWDHSGESGNPGVCIHHPRGDVKKISTVENQPISTYYLDYLESSSASHWKVTWKLTPTEHGITEYGSSGSPLLNSGHKVIGQLHGGYSRCNYPNDPDWFAKFNESWTGHGNDSIQRRMNCWLDSLNTGVQTMEGLLVIPSARTLTSDEQLYSNILIKNSGQLTIQSEVELMGNSRVVVESGGKLIIDGGTLSNVDLVLKHGSSLVIVNGGIIETRNRFKAPVGASVDIVHGKIM